MTETEYEISTPRFFVTKYKGIMKINEQREINEWHRARWIAQRVNTPYIKKVPADWWDMPFDEHKQKWTAEQWAEFNAYAAKLHGDKPN